MLMPPRSTQEGVRGFAIDGAIIVDPASGIRERRCSVASVCRW